jgi:PPP family 3-phenylpropionic acid transporter
VPLKCHACRVPPRSPLPRFLALYAASFGAFGVASAFLPGLLQQDGLSVGAIGVVLAAGTATRLLSGPLGGRLADRTGRPDRILFGCTAAAALIAFAYVPARGLPLLFLISVAHSAVLAPLTPVADALALGSAERTPRFEYGWVRAAGSAAFIAGTLISGQSINQYGLGVIVWLNGGLLAVAAGFCLLIPNRVAGVPKTATASHAAGSIRTLLAVPLFRRLMVIAALVGGSHALHDSFEVIRWHAAGLSAGESSLLWSASVAAELVVFLFLGRPILRHLAPGSAMILCAVAGIVRWGTAAQTASFSILAIVEPLHGLTFALLHLTCMDVIGRVVPTDLAATAQAFYATIAMGATSAAVTLFSGLLYGYLGPAAFWAMALMCAAALPVAFGMHLPVRTISPAPATSRDP